jgi:phosphoglucosamine mutase
MTRLFGSSGIRGLANVEVTGQLAMRLGSALATLHEGGSVVVGRDSRLTGPLLEAALTSGAVACGADVHRVGLLPTPVVAWLTRELSADAGVAVTASHNPAQYNGLKVFNGAGISLYEKEQKTVEKLLESGEFDYAPWDGVGSSVEEDAAGLYIDALTDQLELSGSSKVACDCFCGAASNLSGEAFDAFGIATSLLNANPDGHFPAGNPEPDEKNMQRLGAYVREVKADAGFAFDGDADRMMAVDEKGAFIGGDRLLAVYAASVVENRGGGTVVTHVGASMCVDEMVKKAGGKVVRVRVGDAYITEEMQKRKAVFGGEPIGAWIHPEVHMCPDGILSALKLMEAVQSSGEPLSVFASKAPEYPIRSVKVEAKDKNGTMKRIEQQHSSFFNTRNANTVDGVRLELEEGWILIRASGTEPLIRLTVEGRSEAAVSDLLERGRELVKRCEK